MCKQNKSYMGLFAGLAIVIVVGLWRFSWYWIETHIGTPTDRGTFGDMFGAVNALFSGLAFAGLIITLLYQREELKLQREELAQTREELKGQREEFEEQNKTMKRQRFENTFFNMLSLQQEIVANLSFEYIKLGYLGEREKMKSVGKEIFEKLYYDANIRYDSHNYKGIKEFMTKIGYAEYAKIDSITRLDHYFRHLYQIFKFIDNSKLIENDERYEYACIVNSQLSDYELVILFYNCLSPNGREKFKPLIEKYAIFNNLRDDLLANESDMDEYTEGAYVYKNE